MDSIGREKLPAERRRIEVRKCEPIGRIRHSGRIARLVLPGLEMHGLGRADAQQNSQDYWTSDLQSHCRVEAAPTLLDGGEMEPRRVGDRLDVVVGRQVVISSRDCRKTRIQGQAGDRLRKLEVGSRSGL